MEGVDIINRMEGIMKHTPGSWEVEETKTGLLIQTKDRYIAETVTYGTPTLKANWDYPNARLIAAAPDLLEALQQIHKRTVRR